MTKLSIDTVKNADEAQTNINWETVLVSLRVLADNSHLNIDIGEGNIDAAVHGLCLTYAAVCGCLLPPLKRSRWLPRWTFEKLTVMGLETDRIIKDLTLEALDDNIKRYDEYTEIVDALKFLRVAVIHNHQVRRALTKTHTPGHIYLIQEALNLAKTIRRGTESVWVEKGRSPERTTPTLPCRQKTEGPNFK